MKTTRRHVAVLTTAPTLDLARHLAHTAVAARCCACAQVLPGIESHYWWQGKLECSPEVLVLFKTTRVQLGALEGHLRREHTYQVPQIVVLPITAGGEDYLAWLDEVTRAPRPKPPVPE